MTSKELIQLHKETTDKCLGILIKKNQDYASGENPFKNFDSTEIFGIKAEKGILLRIGDKLARVNNFIDKGKLAVENESVDDAIEDIINYLILLKGLIKDRHVPKVSEQPETKSESFSVAGVLRFVPPFDTDYEYAEIDENRNLYYVYPDSSRKLISNLSDNVMNLAKLSSYWNKTA